MMQSIFFFIVAAVAALSKDGIIGFDGKEAYSYEGKKKPQSMGKKKITLNHASPDDILLHSLKKVSEVKSAEEDDAGLLAAMRLVAKKAYETGDVAKAKNALTNLEASVMYFSKDDKPSVLDAAQEMRSEMCVDHPDNADCQEFMKKFCTDFPDAEACSKFAFDEPLEPAVAEVPDGAVEPNEGWKYDNGADVAEDWRHEYDTEGDTYREICMRHPDNNWCQDRYGADALMAPDSKGRKMPTSLFQMMLAGFLFGLALVSLFFYFANKSAATPAARG